MNYKLTSIVLLLALIAMTWYHFSTKPNTQEVVQMQTEDMSFLDPEIEDYLISMKSSWKDSTTGRFIQVDSGEAKLNRFKNFRKNPGAYPGNRLSKPYGFMFGLEKVHQLVKIIDEHNQTTDSTKLIGIRAYNAISFAKGKPYIDLFIVAVDENGKDFPDLGNDDFPIMEEEKPPILNASAPCPDNCD